MTIYILLETYLFVVYIQLQHYFNISIWAISFNFINYFIIY